MSVISPRNAAEATDAIAVITAAGTGLVSLIFALSAAEVFVSESTSELFGYVQIAGAVLIFAVFMPLIVRLKLRGGKPAGRETTPGYLSALLRQAGLTAFSLTIAFLVLLTVFDQRVLSHISAETAVNLVAAFALAMFSASFFFINRFSPIDDEQGGEL